MQPIDALKKVPIFEELEDSLLKLLVVRSKSLSMPAGDILMTEGDEGKSIYILLSGQVRVDRKTSDGQVVSIAEREAGDSFGEMSLIDGQPRSATVVATAPCEVLIVDQNTFETIVLSHPRAAMAVLRTLVRRLRDQSEKLSEAKHQLEQRAE